MGEATRYVKVPAEMFREGWARNAGHVATVGAVTGRGDNLASALADAGEALTAMATRVHDAPMFGWDEDNRSLWVAVPSALDNGSTHYIVHFDESGQPSVSGCTTSDSAPARDAFKGSEGIQQLPSRFYRD